MTLIKALKTHKSICILHEYVQSKPVPNSSISPPLSYRDRFFGSESILYASPTSLNFFSSSFFSVSEALECRSIKTQLKNNYIIEKKNYENFL